MKLPAVLNIKQYAIVAGCALLLGAVVVGGFVWKYKGDQIELIEANHKTELLERELAETTAKLELKGLQLTFETSLGARKDEINQTYANNVSSISAAVAKLNGYRLQDPYSTRGSGSTNNPGSSGTSAGTGAGTGVLSKEASDFLYNFAGESDVNLEKLRSCQAWSNSVKAEHDKYKRQVDELIKELNKQGLIEKD